MLFFPWKTINYSSKTNFLLDLFNVSNKLLNASNYIKHFLTNARFGNDVIILTYNLTLTKTVGVIRCIFWFSSKTVLFKGNCS